MTSLTGHIMIAGRVHDRPFDTRALAEALAAELRLGDIVLLLLEGDDTRTEARVDTATVTVHHMATTGQTLIELRADVDDDKATPAPRPTALDVVGDELDAFAPSDPEAA